MDDHFDAMLAPRKAGKMDDHFESMLQPSSAAAPKFISAEIFAGKKFGFVFKKGAKGLGYYYDHVQKQPTKIDGYVYQEDVDKKRKFDDADLLVKEQEEEVRDDIEKLLVEAEANIEQLDQNSLKQLLLSFEKKITKNQKMRMKHSEEPEKFMESELELHAEINELYAIAASPELYPTLVDAGSVNSILGMITHENTDISIATMGLLHEMTDVDTILEVDVAMVFIEALLNNQGLELIVQNLSRLDEANDEDAQGVNSSMGCIENLVEIRPDIAILICEKTHILKFLLLRLKVKKFDANKLYCSEILSILLQADESNQIRICNLQGLDGMEIMLQAVSLYRKRDPVTLDEEECVENLFSCLCTTLLQKDNQRRFVTCEGMELMVRCLSEQKHAAVCAMKVIKYATSSNKFSCERLVSAGGMKHVFPLLMGRGLPKRMKKASGAGTSREAEETAIAVISQLILQLHDVHENDISQRLLSKLVESEGEKLDRCAELCAKYVKVLQSTEQQIESTAAALEEGEDEEELQEFTTEENIYSMRLEGGLFILQQLATIIIFACLHDKEKSSLSKAQIKLHAEQLSVIDLLDIIREAAVHLYDKKINDSNTIEDGQVEDGDITDKEIDAKDKRRDLFVSWASSLENFVEIGVDENENSDDV